MKMREKGFLMAAVAGISMGLSAPAPSAAEEKTGDVKCWGVNSCGSHAKCSVKDDDLKAMQELINRARILDGLPALEEPGKRPPA